jgi:hypothetical protein
MKPWVVVCTRTSRLTGEEIGAQILRLENWPDFQGYGPLPGIAEAQFEIRTPDVVGTRIRVRNRDGSTHIEEIVEWQPAERITLEMKEFSWQMKLFSDRFVERWEFERSNGETAIRRSIELQHRSVFGWLVLAAISGLLKNAVDRHLAQIA